jgi:hypothetical protein
MASFFSMPRSLGALVLLLVLPHVLADPATVQYSDCFDEDSNTAQKFTINTIYAQVFENEEFGKHLNLTILGEAPQDIQGLTNTSGSLGMLPHLRFSSLANLDPQSDSLYVNICAYAQRMD